jgi:hypothetical protein
MRVFQIGVLPGLAQGVLEMTEAPTHSINIRSPRFLVARTVAACWRCRALTTLIAVALPPGHETLELDDQAPDEAHAVDTWQTAAQHALLFHIEFLPASVAARLQLLASLRHDGYWANHCAWCDLPQDDQALFCEPGGAFAPASESSAALIEILSVDEPFEAVVAGYAVEPHFLYAMRRK